MSWVQRYRIRSYLRNSIWVAPTLSIFAALIFAVFLTRLEESLGLRTTFGRDIGISLLRTIAASTFTMVVLFVSHPRSSAACERPTYSGSLPGL